MLVADSSSSSGATLTAAIIAAAVSIVVTMATQWYLRRSEERTRTYERRRVALNEAHDAARVLRERLRAYGHVSRSDGGRRTERFEAAEAAFADAESTLDVMITRVDAPRVVAAIAQWRDAAQIALIDQSGEAITDTTERERWAGMNTVVGAALRSRDGLPQDRL